MRFTANLILILLTGCLLFAGTVLGQISQTDSTTPSAGAFALSVYHTDIGSQSPLYNGTAHIPPVTGLKGIVWFQSETAARGSVNYDGIQYKNIPLLYDVVTNQLVVQNPEGYLICLYNDRVQEFSLPGHSYYNKTIHGTPWYYDLVCSGPLSIYVRRVKVIDQGIEGMEVTYSINMFDSYYAEKGGHYYRIGKESDLEKLVADKKKEIKAFIRQTLRPAGIKFRKSPEQVIVQITGYYNQLSK